MITLARVSKEQLHETFLEAFSDYAMDASHATEEGLLGRAGKNAVDFDLSVGAFDGERMVGFILIGIDLWQGELAAFDAGTGVVPDFRGEGLTTRMLEYSLPALEARGVRRFLVEVLKENKRAIRAYEKAEFKTTREFACLNLPLASFRARAGGCADVVIHAVDRQAVCSLAEEADWQPSWENSFGSIERAPDELVALGAWRDGRLVGAIAFSPALNWILTILVERGERRKGIASALVQALVERLPQGAKAIQITNVDRSDRGMLDFLGRLGFRHWVDQYEMARPITEDAI